jgi:hypothetical protein
LDNGFCNPIHTWNRYSKLIEEFIQKNKTVTTTGNTKLRPTTALIQRETSPQKGQYAGVFGPLCCIKEMNHQTKKNIRVLAEKYHHSIQYDKEVVRLEAGSNTIEVEPTNKGVLTIRYNALKETEKLEIPSDEVYDVLIELLRRKETAVIHRKEGDLITLDLYRQEEGTIVDQWLKQLKAEINTKGIAHKQLGGNRIEAEYYKGLLILTDDLVYYLSNVIELEK